MINGLNVCLVDAVQAPIGGSHEQKLRADLRLERVRSKCIFLAKQGQSDGLETKTSGSRSRRRISQLSESMLGARQH